MTHLSLLTVEDLAEGICLRAGRIAAAQAELLTWVAEFDRREGWAGPGMLSCAHWLVWRIGLSPGAAREHVRVARRLEELPEVAAAFGDGRISYSKVRAITRAAEPDDGIAWVVLARHSSAAQLEKVVRGVQRAKAAEAAQADPELAEWTVRTRKRYDRDGNLVITIITRPQYAPVVEAGLEAKRAELQRQLDAQGHNDVFSEPPSPVVPDDQPPLPDVPAGTSSADVTTPPAAAVDDVDLDAPATGWPEGTTRGQVREAVDAFDPQWGTPAPPEEALAHPVTARPAAAPDVPAGTPKRPSASDGDALLALAQEALAAEQKEHPDIARRRRAQLTARIDPLSGWARQADGELLPPTSLRAVMKTLPGRSGVVRLRPVTVADLRRLDLGRSQREASAALRELLGTIDGERCRFPGCTRHKKLHAHHVVFWRDGGPTDLANVVHRQTTRHRLAPTRASTGLLRASPPTVHPWTSTPPT